MNKYRGKYDDSYKLLKTEGNQDLKTQILVEQQLNRRKYIQKPNNLLPKQSEKILDLLCLSTQQLKQVFKQPVSTHTRIKVIRNTSLPKDFFIA